MTDWREDIESGWMTAERENEDGTTSVIYRLSGIGACPRALLADRRREQPVLPTAYVKENVLDKGWEIEDIVMEKLAKQGFEIIERQRELFIPLLGNKIVVRGRGDGHVRRWSDGKEFALEIKGAGISVMPLWVKGQERYLRAHQRYSAQATGEMIGTGLPLLYCIHYRPGPDETNELGEVMKLDMGEMLTFEVEDYPADWNKIRQKIVSVEAWYQRMEDELPECEATKDEEWFCAYSWLHDPKKVEDLDDQAELVRQAWDLDRQINQLENEIVPELKRQYKAMKDQLLAALNQRGITKGFVEGITVSKVRAHKRNQLLKDGIARLKRDLGEDTYKGYLDEIPIPEHVRLSVPKEKEGGGGGMTDGDED